jgi:hypothetical protein
VRYADAWAQYMCPTRNVVIAQRVSVSPNASAKRHDETDPSLPQRAPSISHLQV